MAINQALNVLSWYENLPSEERPPEYLWADDKGLEMWWQTVEDKRNDGVQTNRGLSDHAHDDQTPTMTENDHARFLKQAMA